MVGQPLPRRLAAGHGDRGMARRGRPGGDPGPDRDGRLQRQPLVPEAFDSAVVYGFCPQRELALPEAAPLVHGADERAAVADIDLAARFYRDIVQAVLG